MRRMAIRSQSRFVSHGMRHPAAAAMLPSVRRSPVLIMVPRGRATKMPIIDRSHTDASGPSIARQVLLDEAKDSNTVFSPLPLNVVLSLVTAGASSPTLEEVLKFLKSDSVDDVNQLYSELFSVVLADGNPKGGPLISTANAVWIHELLPLSRRVVEIMYKASCFDVDFITTKGDEIVSKVNSCIEKKTNGFIKEALLCGSVQELTRLILVNTVYFKGEWSQTFDEWMTRDFDFHLRDGGKVMVPFMRMSDTETKQLISAFDGFKVLGLPYKKGDDERLFTMYIFLPDSKDGLPAMENKLLGAPSLDQHLPRERVHVGEFRVPRFKISFDFKASETLKQLGVQLPFKPGGLTEMVDSTSMDSEELFVGEIYHKSCIDMNEQGTEAAAFPASRIRPTFGYSEDPPPPRIDFVADHPFMFLIREDNTGAVLFVGHVLNPQQQ